MNNIFKTSLVQRHIRLKLYKILAKPTLVYGSETWTLRRADERRLMSAEMRFIRRTAGYTLLDRKKSEDILQELKVDPIMDFVQEYRKSWKEHVIRMNKNRLPKKKCSSMFLVAKEVWEDQHEDGLRS
jgi:hypothetical protein